MASQPAPLTALKEGSTATIASINLPESQRSRLQEMGLLAGTKVQVVRYAPMGDPLEIKVRGYNLTLRKHEAQLILVTTET